MKTSNMNTEDKAQQVNDYLKKMWKDEKESPYNKKMNRRQEQFEKSKREKYSLFELLDGGNICDECLVAATCTKSFTDNTACDKFREAVEEILRENKIRLRD